MKQIFEESIRLLEKQESFSMATVITRDGSAPRGPGAKMIIREDGTISGTIGGGLLEAEIMRTAREVIRDRKAKVAEYHLRKGDFNAIDMTCGGDMEVLIDYIDASDPVNLSISRRILELTENKNNSYLVTYIPSSDTELSAPKQSIIMPDKSCIGKLPVDIEDLYPLVSNLSSYKVINVGNKRFIVEQTGFSHFAYIFGAGHVGQKAAELLKFTGFNVSVIDDRPEFANKERFPFADNIYVVQNFKEDIGFLDINDRGYIIIVTRGHANDEDALRNSLKTKPAYIGMIGSKRKIKVIYNDLLKEGFLREDIDRVHAPIGLEIGAETPEEIAVSIVAEMIKVRSDLSKKIVQ